MAAGNKIYVFGPGVLKAQADVGKFFGINSASQTILTNLIVLAERTAQSTACKKDSTASAENSYQRLFTKMKAGKGNPKVSRFAAEPCRICSIHPARSWALMAVFIKLVYL